MRVCYRMKKLSTFSKAVYRDWKRAPNFVAKRWVAMGSGRIGWAAWVDAWR